MTQLICFQPINYSPGDDELAVDIVANNVIFQNLKNCGSVATASSAEAPTEGNKEKSLMEKEGLNYRFVMSIIDSVSCIIFFKMPWVERDIP